jgi:hypothetical protein
MHRGTINNEGDSDRGKSIASDTTLPSFRSLPSQRVTRSGRRYPHNHSAANTRVNGAKRGSNETDHPVNEDSTRARSTSPKDGSGLEDMDVTDALLRIVHDTLEEHDLDAQEKIGTSSIHGTAQSSSHRVHFDVGLTPHHLHAQMMSNTNITPATNAAVHSDDRTEKEAAAQLHQEIAEFKANPYDQLSSSGEVDGDLPQTPVTREREPPGRDREIVQQEVPAIFASPVKNTYLYQQPSVQGEGEEGLPVPQNDQIHVIPNQDVGDVEDMDEASNVRILSQGKKASTRTRRARKSRQAPKLTYQEPTNAESPNLSNQTLHQPQDLISQSAHKTLLARINSSERCGLSTPQHTPADHDLSATQDGDDEIRPHEMMVDETVFIQSSPSGQITVSLRSDCLQAVMSQTSKPAWTGRGDKWQSQINKEQPNTTNCRRLWKTLHYLLRTISGIPPISDGAEQAAYLRQKEDDLMKTFKLISTYINHISERELGPLGDNETIDPNVLEARKACSENLALLIVPAIIANMEKAFFSGGMVHNNDDKAELPKEGYFTCSTLQILMRLNGWARRLAAKVAYEAKGNRVSEEITPWKKRQRIAMGEKLEILHKDIQEAVDRLEDEIDRPRRLQEMKEKDEKMKAFREAKERELADKSARQRQLFLASLEKMQHSSSQSQRSTGRSASWSHLSRSQPPISRKAAGKQRMWSTTQHYDPEQRGSNSRSGRTTRKPPSEYYSSASSSRRMPYPAQRGTAHFGSGAARAWTKDEQRMLLQAMRSVKNPDLEAVAGQLRREMPDVMSMLEKIKAAMAAVCRDRGRPPVEWSVSQSNR